MKNEITTQDNGTITVGGREIGKIHATPTGEYYSTFVRPLIAGMAANGCGYLPITQEQADRHNAALVA